MCAFLSMYVCGRVCVCLRVCLRNVRECMCVRACVSEYVYTCAFVCVRLCVGA